MRETAPPDPVCVSFLTKSPLPEAIDLFFFDTLGIRALDSYQQVTDTQQPVYGLSGTGAKRLVALSGRAGQTQAWARIRTYGDLCKHSFSLDNDSPEHPLLFGEKLLEDGASRLAVLELRPALAAIRLHSVSCDFSDRPYADATFFNTKLYLCYAGSECLPLGAGDREPVSWVNPGYLDSLAVSRLPDPAMLYQAGCGTIGLNRSYPEKIFYCYPCPDTRLVLEGSVGGIRCYYPIPLPGLVGGDCLQLDVTIRRIGSASPDIPTVSGAIVLETQTLPWEQREPYTVTY